MRSHTDADAGAAVTFTGGMHRQAPKMHTVLDWSDLRCQHPCARQRLDLVHGARNGAVTIAAQSCVTGVVEG